MRKLLIFLFFLFSAPLFAQQIWWVDTTSTGLQKKVYLGNFGDEITDTGFRYAKLPVKIDGSISAYLSSSNSSSTPLDSAGSFTGTAESTEGFSSLTISILADSAGTLTVAFSDSLNMNDTLKLLTFPYTAGDSTFTKFIPIAYPYYQVGYSTAALDTSNLALVTLLHMSRISDMDENGVLYVDEANQDSVITLLNTLIERADSLKDQNDRHELLLADIRTATETIIPDTLAALNVNLSYMRGVMDSVIARLITINEYQSRIAAAVEGTLSVNEVNATQFKVLNATITTSVDSSLDFTSFTPKWTSIYAECVAGDTVWVSSTYDFTAATITPLTYGCKTITSDYAFDKVYLKSNGSVGVTARAEGR